MKHRRDAPKAAERPISTLRRGASQQGLTAGAGAATLQYHLPK
jgi:hypothetical protein